MNFFTLQKESDSIFSFSIQLILLQFTTLQNKLQKLMNTEIGKNKMIILEDCNGIVGEGKEDSVVGAHGTWQRDDRRNKTVEYYMRKRKLMVVNMWFKQYKRRYTISDK